MKTATVPVEQGDEMDSPERQDGSSFTSPGLPDRYDVDILVFGLEAIVRLETSEKGHMWGHGHL